MSNEKSEAIDKRTTAQVSAQSNDIAPPQRKNIQMLQNVVLIWLDGNIDEDSADCHDTINQLRRVVHDVNKYTDADRCIEFLLSIENEKACMIISGALSEYMVPLVHEISQLGSIFILCNNRKLHEQRVKQWPKINGVFIEIEPICEALKAAVQRCEQDAMPINIMDTTTDLSKKSLDQLDPSFMYTQLLKEILLSIKFEQKHIGEFIQYCRIVLADNKSELAKLKTFEQEHRERTPIWWYTCESFLYPMLNRVLRVMDADLIVSMGFFISDLHRHIEQLHQEQFTGVNSEKSLTVYRGQGLPKADFEKLSKTKGGLLSFNNFLSTSKQHQVARIYVKSEPSNAETVGVLFVMTIDPSQSNTPFASITGVSYFRDQEDEVLFSMHTVFRIGEITPMDGYGRLFQVTLTLTSDNDKDLRVLMDHIREETFSDKEGWYRLGEVMKRMGQFNKAQQVYEILLEQTTDELEKASIYGQLVQIQRSKGEYEEAITFYEKSLAIKKKILPPTHLYLAASYNNIGLVYQNMGDYPQALSYYEKALAIQQQSLPPNHPDVAASYNNIGNVYNNMGDNPQALSYYEKALAIRQQSLPPNHPDLAASYNNIGILYKSMGDYPQALSYYEKALAIRQQSLPPNHPDLAASYNNIGILYKSMGHYSQALSYYEKALAIQQQSLPPNHPDVAAFYNNIGNVYNNMGDNPQALSYYEKALAIRQQSLPPNHPDLAASYNNIGILYNNMGDNPQALSYYEKALAIRQQSLPPNHPDLAASYNNIGILYKSMGDYPQALSYYEKALAIRQQSLPPNHPDLAASYNNIGILYKSMGDYPQALSYYEKALAIEQQSLPPNHPDLAASYGNIALVYYSMSDYPQALSYYEKDLEITKQSLSPNHPDVAMSYNNIGVVYESMKNYSEARVFYGCAVDTAQRSLPSGHPDLKAMRNNLERVKKKL